MVTANLTAIVVREFTTDSRRLQKLLMSLGEFTRYPVALPNHRIEIVRLLGE